MTAIAKAVAAPALVACLWSPATLAECINPTGPSLRLMTYNASFQAEPLPDFWNDPNEPYLMSDDNRAVRMRTLIEAEDPDVIVLNEINKDEVKDKLALELHWTWRHYVKNVDDFFSPYNDSGLMLFSKWPLVPLSKLHITQDPPGEGWGYADTFVNGQWVESSSVITRTNVLIYEDAFSPDNKSEKGVVAARIINECDGDRPFNVVFSHTQATYPDDPTVDQAAQNWDRQQQLGNVRWLIENSLTPSQMRAEPVFLLGDLNVNGNPNTAGQYIEAVDEGDDVDVFAFSEWQRTFDSAGKSFASEDEHGGFFSCNVVGGCTYDANTRTGTFLTDGWGFETSPLDIGQTSAGGETGGNWLGLDDDEGERLDYVAHNQPRLRRGGLLPVLANLCLQHIWRGMHFVHPSFSGVVLSDHIPLFADFNLEAPRCRPHPRQPTDGNNPTPAVTHDSGPEPVTWDLSDPLDIDREFVGAQDGVTRLTFPGSMQWYVIDQQVSMELEVTGSVAAVVYQGRDLSRPIAPFNGECVDDTPRRTRRCKYSLMEPPYYVRAYGSMNRVDEDRTVSGNYRILFHRFNCKDIDNACLLRPAIAYQAFWPANNVLNPALSDPVARDQMFFRFLTEFSSVGDPPQLSFLVEHQEPASPDPLIESMTRADGTTALPSPLAFTPDAGTWSDDGSVRRRTTRPNPPDLPGSNSLPAAYFLKVQRTSADNPGLLDHKWPISVTYKTNLTYISDMTLEAYEDNTDVGDDDVWADFRPEDEGGYPHSDCDPPFPGYECHLVGWFDDETVLRILDGRLYKSFTGFLRPNLWEDVYDDDDYRFIIQDPNRDAVIDSLNPDAVRDDKLQWIGYRTDGFDYWYRLDYRRDHEKPSCCVDTQNCTTKLKNYCPSGTACSNGVCQ